MTNKEKAILLAKCYQDGLTDANLYYQKHKSGKRQAGYTIGNLISNIEILTKHTISKIKK